MKYEVVVRDVKEVILRGSADLSFWSKRLASQDLHPALGPDGRAQIHISTTESVFRGVRFREGILSVFTTETAGGTGRDGAYLFGAYSTVRLFAWVERALFGSPHAHGAIPDGLAGNASTLSLGTPQARAIEARMQGHGESAARVTETWEGTIHLPRDPTRPKRPGRIYHARLEGTHDVYPYREGADALTLHAGSPPAALLRASGFRPREWRVGAAGIHARSKSYERPI